MRCVPQKGGELLPWVLEVRGGELPSNSDLPNRDHQWFGCLESVLAIREVIKGFRVQLRRRMESEMGTKGTGNERSRRPDQSDPLAHPPGRTGDWVLPARLLNSEQAGSKGLSESRLQASELAVRVPAGLGMVGEPPPPPVQPPSFASIYDTQE